MTGNGMFVHFPEYPCHNYLELQRSKIQIGDRRNLSWETTYSAAMRPQTADTSQQKIDTVMLQKTHWTNGNIPTTKDSEYVDKYRQFNTSSKRDPAYTRDEMMKTTFSLGNSNEPFPERVVQREYHEGIPKRENYREQFTATHFDLSTNSAPKWETTNRASYRPNSAAPAAPINHELNRGLGTKSNFEQLGAFGTPNSLNKDTYKDWSGHRTQTASSTAVYVDRGNIVFDQGMTQANQRTSVKLGGLPTSYSTTTQDGYVKSRDIQTAVDPQLARLRRAQLTRSNIGQGNPNIPMADRSVTHESIVPHPEHKPPPPAERTAFVSHCDFRNYDGKMSTTMRDDYPAKKAEPARPANMGLQQSHCNIGYTGINENRSLYSDTFKNPGRTMDRVDANAMRAFHTAHHSKTDTGTAANTGKTTYQVTYLPQPDFRPPPSCDALKGGHNVVPQEDRFVVKESNMKESFKPPSRCDQATRQDNALQKSHLQLKSNVPNWTTTQQDYFLWYTYDTNPKNPCPKARRAAFAQALEK